MPRNERTFAKHVWVFTKTAVLFALLILVSSHLAWSQDNSMDGMQNMPGMDHSQMKMPAAPEDAATAAARLAVKRSSEFNHHLAGFILVLAGLAIFFEDPLGKRWPFVKYVWPMCFLVGGTLLLVFSDPEVWPVGSESWGYALSHDLEVLQHKVFSIILLAIGAVEFERARGRLKALWTGFIFSIVALSGAVLLLFHVHGGDMTAPGAMQSMEHIKTEHGWFAVAGFGIIATNALAVLPLSWKPVLRKVWPALVIVLGCLLLIYTE